MTRQKMSKRKSRKTRIQACLELFLFNLWVIPVLLAGYIFITGWLPEPKHEADFRRALSGPAAVGCIAILGPISLVISSIIRLAIHKYRPEPLDGHCEECGYNLQGLESKRCPECGEDY